MENFFLVTRQKRNLALLSLLRWTGYRITEVLSLKIKDVSLPDRRIVQFIKVFPRHMKKKTPRDPVPVHPRLKRDLESWVSCLIDSGAGNNESLFPSRKGGAPISYIQAYRIIKDVADAADVYENVACHSLRKTFCERVYEGTGKDIIATQKIMGHSDASSTAAYIGVKRELMIQAVLNQ